MSETTLHQSVIGLISLAANIASNHPKLGLCQIDRLRQYGVSQEQIDATIEIARHIRDEAALSLDARFDDALAQRLGTALTPAAAASDNVCCTPTSSGQSCC